MADVTLRPVKEADLKLIYEWRNHPKTREMSFNSAEIKWDEHLAFWKKRLSDREAVSFIIVSDGKPVGAARLDKRYGCHEVSISLAPEVWGKGIGTKALALLLAEAKKRGIVKVGARVKPENPASKKIFQNNGFAEKYAYYEVKVE